VVATLAVRLILRFVSGFAPFAAYHRRAPHGRRDNRSVAALGEAAEIVE
jgi:hypothetical protein